MASGGGGPPIAWYGLLRVTRARQAKNETRFDSAKLKSPHDRLRLAESARLVPTGELQYQSPTRR